MSKICEFNIDLNNPIPAAIYTIASESYGEYKHQTHERYGHVRLHIAECSNPAYISVYWGTTFHKDEETVYPTSGIPQEYSHYICEGIKQITHEWQRMRCPIVAVRITIAGGSYHIVNASGAAYKIATYKAFIKAVERVGLKRIL
jgi:translation elongation factor EF-G